MRVPASRGRDCAGKCHHTAPPFLQAPGHRDGENLGRGSGPGLNLEAEDERGQGVGPAGAGRPGETLAQPLPIGPGDLRYRVVEGAVSTAALTSMHPQAPCGEAAMASRLSK